MIINGINSSKEFGVELMEKSIQPPTSNRIIEKVPYMNSEYDFSNLYNELTFGERKVTCKYAIPTVDTERLNIKYSQLLNIIMKYELILEFDDIKGYYFKGKIDNTPNFEEISIFGTLTVVYSCYPFKVSTLQDGHDIWDEFNFELDMSQDTEFEVENIKNIQLYNNGATGINPIIVCSSNMEIIKGNINYKFNAGESKSWSFKLDKGLNNLTIKGTGTIEFKWYKEVL